MEQARTALHALRILGYVNLAALVIVLLRLKGGWDSWLLLVLPPLLTVSGAVLYYSGWNRAFPQVSKAEGRRFMRPYLLGLYLIVAAAGLVFGLSLLAGHRGA